MSQLLECETPHERHIIGRCWKTQSQHLILASRPNVPDEEMFAKMCCSERLHAQCIQQVLNHCPNSNVNPRQHLREMIDLMAGEFYTLICGKWNDQHCQETGYFEKLRKTKLTSLNHEEFIFIPIMRITSKLTLD